MTSRFITSLGALLLFLFISITGVNALRASAFDQPRATPTPASTRAALAPSATLMPAANLQSAADRAGQPETVPFVRTELFFGSERPVRVVF